VDQTISVASTNWFTMFLILNERELRKFMAAIDNLTSAITDQTAATVELANAVKNIPAGGTGGATEQQVADAATAVTANTQAVRDQIALLPKPIV